MPKVDILNMEGSVVDSLELNDAVFGIEPNHSALHQVVKAQLANKRQGTQSALTRSEVSGGGIKPWRQKGTGRARVGTRRNPVWTGGGVAFGPHPREYGFKMPKKMRKAALRSALSDKFANGEIIVFDELAMEAPKTKTMVALLNQFEANNAIVVMDEFNENVFKSVRNIAGVMPLEACGINVYNVLGSQKLVMTKAAVAKVEEVLG